LLVIDAVTAVALLLLLLLLPHLAPSWLASSFLITPNRMSVFRLRSCASSRMTTCTQMVPERPNKLVKADHNGLPWLVPLVPSALL
jgi:hypothetical protein